MGVTGKAVLDQAAEGRQVSRTLHGILIRLAIIDTAYTPHRPR